ncbi:hypothetical protein [Erythrobacter sanguineus]|uniref:Uncharacterized protein n=1 Tax=Erythrobacter sanguineus TaxID=198312 RepID=A0A1M7RY10_9SPHN|nr:hypothetical protein [Erythrobacter sanguineus]SHN51034.1 hypothetical protein SAMN02745193_00587 [Erythrobacter sanguineus]
MNAFSRPDTTPFAAFVDQSSIQPDAIEAQRVRAKIEPCTHGTWLVSSIDLRNPEGDLLTRAVFDKIEAARQVGNPRKRRQPESGKLRQERLVRAILANGLACRFHRDPPLVAYRRTSGFYGKEPRWLSARALARTVDQMASLGLLYTRRGKWGDASSTYSLSHSLLELSEQVGVVLHSLTSKLPSERLIRLREANAGGPEITFEHNPETESWAKQLAAYNAFVARHNLAIEPSEIELAGWVKKVNDSRNEGKPKLVKPELFKTDLYRMFNNASFTQGGRLYGGWWIGAPKHVRAKITIDGRPTVEADYSGCAIRMLYHEKGIDYRDDPYAIAPLVAYAEENGLAPEHFREGVKRLMQALINGDEGGAPELARIEGFTFKPFLRRDVRAMIEQAHPHIADAFGGGSGLRLQRADSDLALTIISNLMEKGILALPIHDSFLVAKENKDQLIFEMNNSYFNKFCFNPVIN